MRLFTTALIVLVLFALGPQCAMGKPPGGGSGGAKPMGGGGGSGSGNKNWSGSNGSGNKNWSGYYGNHGGHWLNGVWYADPGYYATQPYTVARPIDSAPEPTYSGGPITISNPRSNAAALSYTLNGTVYTIQPGYTQTLQEDRAWAIEFNRGPNQGQARYGLQTGAYSFGANGSGWELFNRPVETTSQNSPANPPPPVTVPMNPSPTP